MSESEHRDEKEPELVVDTDWKEQVAKEKEAASRTVEQDQETSQSEQDLTPTSPESESGSTPSAGEAGEHDFPPPPPATFEVLISMLFTQAMSMLGQMPDPGSGETNVNKPYAKHYIDTLDMLGEKTSGNLSDDESKMLAEALHALRMMYVNAK